MHLLITLFAAVFTTVVWYNLTPDKDLYIGKLCFMFWGASLMWLADAIIEYAELGALYFTPSPEDMINDIFLGLSVIALALVIWVIIILVKDPKGRIKNILLKKKIS